MPTPGVNSSRQKARCDEKSSTAAMAARTRSVTTRRPSPITPQWMKFSISPRGGQDRPDPDRRQQRCRGRPGFQLDRVERVQRYRRPASCLSEERDLVRRGRHQRRQRRGLRRRADAVGTESAGGGELPALAIVIPAEAGIQEHWPARALPNPCSWIPDRARDDGVLGPRVEPRQAPRPKNAGDRLKSAVQ